MERKEAFYEFHTLPSKEKQQESGGNCMSCGVPFCQSGKMISGMVSGCPLNNLCPEWNDLVSIGNWKEAYERLAKTNCFPEFTSRVCPALCEAACTGNLSGVPVATKTNERAIIENAWEAGFIKANPPKVRTGKSVAIVGSGPSGMAAAMQLNKRGHTVTVFERSDRVGGLLCYGIPNMKLDKSVIDRRVRLMEAEGIQFVTGINVGRDIKAEKLLREYDRVLLCCGASKPRDIKASGRELEGIYFAVDFLASVTKSLLDSELEDQKYINPEGKHVVVIGGGDTGNDCVGTSIRLGAKSVTQIEMMPMPPLERTEDNPWPEWPKVLKTDYGQREAIALYGKDPRIYQTTVKEFVGNKKGELKQLKLVGLAPKKNEATGRMEMKAVEGSEKLIAADMVFIAAGFLGAEEYIAKEFKTALDERMNVKTEAESYQTNIPNVFVAGDMHRGQSLVVWAIREGREAARAIDSSLMCYTNL